MILDEGYTTFDLADIYGPAEEYVGAFRKGPLASKLSNKCQFFTKWVHYNTVFDFNLLSIFSFLYLIKII